jgi:hypothetical protein
LQPLSTESHSLVTVDEELKRWERGSEKRIKKLEKSFGSLEKTITFAAAKTKTSSLKLLGRREARVTGE